MFDTVQLPRLKARRRDATASTFCVGEVFGYVLLYLYFAGVTMAYNDARVPLLQATLERNVKREFSGEQSEFECLPDAEDRLWTLFHNPGEIRSIISGIEMKEWRMFLFKNRIS